MTQAPIVIAHRGASGYLPEHSPQAKALAYGQCADYLEQDVIASRDHELVVLHDLYLDDISDVRERFPERARTDGHFYVIDFDLRELKQLRLMERRKPGSAERLYDGRFPAMLPEFRISTLAEEIELIQGLNRATGRRVGIYPEIKDPDWHKAQGFDLAAAVIETLQRYGYESPQDLCFVQCFDAAELRRVRNELGCRLRLVQLVDGGDHQLRHLSERGLAAIREYADAVGPAYAALFEGGVGGESLSASPAASAIRAAGLMAHPYTFRKDRLAPGLDVDFETLLAFFWADIRVDGLFSDFPDIAVRVRGRLFPAA
jgi:glycerophosphoryl diester phosphodiesterase